MLFNRQLSNTSETLFRKPGFNHRTLWDADPAGDHIDLFAKGNADLRTLVEWMDMGVQFQNTVTRK